VKRTFIGALFFLSACASGSSIMTSSTFYDVPIGATKHELIAQAGSPYAVHQKGGNVEELKYIERLKIGARNVQETHYIFTLKEGKVTSKRTEVFLAPPTTFDSYEMQTTDGS
jgi:hypothetical protein